MTAHEREKTHFKVIFRTSGRCCTFARPYVSGWSIVFPGSTLGSPSFSDKRYVFKKKKRCVIIDRFLYSGEKERLELAEH